MSPNTYGCSLFNLLQRLVLQLTYFVIEVHMHKIFIIDLSSGISDALK